MAQSTATLLEGSAEAAPAQRQSQVNARIDAKLKATGDAGLAAAGYTPTQAVRALWALATRFKNEPVKIRVALDPDGDVTPDDLAERNRRLAALRRGAGLVDNLCEQYGLPGTSRKLAALPYRELRDALMDEHFAEKGLIDG